MLRCHDNDAAFLFSKLRVGGAFMASASVRQYGLEKSFRKYYSCKEKMLVEKCGLTPRIQKILDDGSFDDILRVQEKCIAINFNSSKLIESPSVNYMPNARDSCLRNTMSYAGHVTLTRPPTFSIIECLRREMNSLKHRNLLSLLPFIPAVHHGLYNSLKSSKGREVEENE
uniref:Uncharacterized protein n=1 Tax=Timema poppense TaxID=170557 RepID=A0A7R9DA04_TIMPO|nr:unnamed protein product [Timema poppensis]